MTETKQVIRSSSVMAVGTVLSRLTGVARTAAIVAVIGFGPFSDAYTIANTIPNVIYTIALGGAITAVFLPQIMRAMNNDRDSGASYTNKLITASVLVLLALTVITFLAAPLLINLYGPSDWPTEVRETAVIFARFLLPQIFLFGLFAMLQQVLNARKHFAVPMYAPIGNNLVVITVAVFLLLTTNISPGATPSRTEVIALGVGTTGGLLVQVLLLAPILHKLGFRFRFDFRFRGSGLLKPVRLAIWSIGFVAVNQISYIAITRLSASSNVLSTESGGVSVGFTSFQNAQLIFFLPYAVITVSLVTALFPRMTEAANKANLVNLKEQVRVGLTGVILTLLPATVVLVLTAPYLSVFLFARGASTLDESIATGQLVQLFCLGLLPFSIFYLLLRIFYARENTAKPFWLNLILNLVALSIAIAAYQLLPLQLKVLGLVGAMVGAYFVATAITFLVARREIGGLGVAPLLTVTAKSLLVSGLVALACWLVLNLISPEISGDTLTNLFALLGACISAGVVLLVAWRLLGIRSLRFFRAS